MQTITDEFAELIVPFTQILYGRAMQLEGSRSAADDLVQDTIERALRSREQFTSGTNICAWLMTIMSHLFIDCRRRGARETLLSRESLDLPAPEPEIPEAWEWISERQVRDAVAQLCPGLRSLLLLFLDGKHSYRDLSEMLGVPENTIGTRLWRARKNVRLLLQSGAPARAPQP